MRLGIVVSEFNFDITMMMLEQAKAHAAFLGVEVAEVVIVPGVFDMPLAIQTLLKRVDIDGVVCLGAVIQGDTNHDEVVISHAARKMADLSLVYEKPVGLGVTGPGMTRLQAMDRIDRAKAAVEAAVKLYKAVKKASGNKERGEILESTTGGALTVGTGKRKNGARRQRKEK